jgi:hypothetical protein
MMTHGDLTIHRGGMWLSRRRTFRAGDPGWDEYIAFIGLPHLREVRTLDGVLNQDLGWVSVSECTRRFRSTPDPVQAA